MSFDSSLFLSVSLNSFLLTAMLVKAVKREEEEKKIINFTHLPSHYKLGGSTGRNNSAQVTRSEGERSKSN